MKRLVTMLFAVTVVACLCSLAFGASGTPYVIVNNQGVHGNSASVYTLNTTTGVLTLVAVLVTHGDGLSGTNVHAGFGQQAVTNDGRCVFVMDVDSSDVASFSSATGYAEVGQYSNPALISDGNEANLTLAPTGKFLYATYGATGNVGAWAVNSDCSLTFIAAYVPSGGGNPGNTGGPLKVTPNGAYLVVGGMGFGVESFAIDQATGMLTDLGFLSFENVGNCNGDECSPYGIDFTKDSKIVVFGGGTSLVPNALGAEITSTGLTNPREVYLLNPAGLRSIGSPFFSAAGYSGSGNLFWTGGNVTKGTVGILTTKFTENPPSAKVINTTLISTPQNVVGNLAVTGNLMVVVVPPNQLSVFSINSDGSLTQLSTITDPYAGYLFSLSVFPNTR